MKVENYKLEDDLYLACQKASSFPEGIQDAIETLHKKMKQERNFQLYGISRPEKGKGIVYYSCAKVKSKNDAEIYGLEFITIPAGIYYSIEIENFHQDLSSIGKAFEKILSLKGIDSEGYCIESYHENNVRCMVRTLEN